MNPMCLLGFHKWERVGEIKPICTASGGFDAGGLHIGHYAMGKCSRCGSEKLQRCYGRFSYYPSEEITESKYVEEWKAREL